MSEEQGLLGEHREVFADRDWREEVWEKFDLVVDGRWIEGVRSLEGRIDLELMLQGEIAQATEWTEQWLKDQLGINTEDPVRGWDIHLAYDYGKLGRHHAEQPRAEDVC